MMVMMRALYGLTNSGIAWKKRFAEKLRDMDFVLTLADPNIYCRRESKTNDEEMYWP